MPLATPIGTWLKASNTVQPKTALSPRSRMPLAMLIKAWRHGSAKNGPQPKEPNAISYANKSVAESQRHSPAKKTALSPKSRMPLAMLIEAWLKACNKVQPERWPFRPLKKAKGHHGQMSGRCPRICSLKSHKKPYRVA